MSNEWVVPPEFTDLVRLDNDRKKRRGYPEAVLTTNKSSEQLRQIAETRDAESVLIFTRATSEQIKFLQEILPGGDIYAEANLFVHPQLPQVTHHKKVLVITAGSSDYAVGLEAAITARALGRNVEMLTDVGIAGLSRLLSKLEFVRSFDCIITVAGMDGALPGVVAGLVEVPVIAVPTSVGYGAAFEGLAPLLTMLNSCAPGVAVVNIDNGYGAGHLAAQITR
ncbi:MAG: nickel pincer cofactor biosynthesis protein LarB [Candidatus Nanopelagicaceae bacterium]